MNQPAVEDTSVLFSLQELAALEDERIQEEEAARAAARTEAERRRAEAEAAVREAEEARRQAEANARAEAARREAEDEARREAIRLAEVERVRVETEAAMAREMAEREAEHQRKLAALENDAERRRLRRFGTVGLVLTLLIGGGATAGAVSHFQSLRQRHDQSMFQLSSETEQLLRDRHDALELLDNRLSNAAARLERDETIRSELSATRDGVATARRQLDGNHPTASQLDHYEEALADFSREVSRQQRRSRYAELETVRQTLMLEMKNRKNLPSEWREAKATAEAARSRVDGYDPDGEALGAYDRALEKLALAAVGLEPVAENKAPAYKGPTTSRGATTTKPDRGDPVTGCSGKVGDPLCGLTP